MNYLFIITLVLMVYVVFQNARLFKKYKHNKVYIEAYQKLLTKPDEAKKDINNFINNEKSIELKSKGKVLLIYALINEDEDAKEEIESLDLKPIFYKKNFPNKEMLSMNSDSFIWLMMCLSIAYKKKNETYLDALYAKVNALSELENRLEVVLFNAIYSLLSNKEDHSFLNKLIDGEYSGYTYEKNMIGLYKRMAAASIAMVNELEDDYYKEDLRVFSKTMIGSCYLNNLGIYEEYKPITEEENKEIEVSSEEVTEEENISEVKEPEEGETETIEEAESKEDTKQEE